MPRRRAAGGRRLTSDDAAAIDLLNSLADWQNNPLH
jgi:hypothetical protein